MGINLILGWKYVLRGNGSVILKLYFLILSIQENQVVWLQTRSNGEAMECIPSSPVLAMNTTFRQ